MNGLQGIISRKCDSSLSGSKIKRFKENHIAPLLTGQEDLELSGEVSTDPIDFLSKQIVKVENTFLNSKVPSECKSTDIKKGKGNVKNGNKYLAWAFSEAAEFARCFNESARAFFDRKATKTNRMISHGTLAHKLARTAY
jgi:transposase